MVIKITSVQVLPAHRLVTPHDPVMEGLGRLALAFVVLKVEKTATLSVAAAIICNKIFGKL